MALIGKWRGFLSAIWRGLGDVNSVGACESQEKHIARKRPQYKARKRFSTLAIDYDGCGLMGVSLAEDFCAAVRVGRARHPVKTVRCEARRIADGIAASDDETRHKPVGSLGPLQQRV